MIEWAPLILFAAVFVVLLLGYPVALTLAGTGLMAAAIGLGLGIFDASLLMATPNRVFGIISNQTLVAVPLFVFMGIVLEQSRIAERLLDSMGKVFATAPGGLGIAVVLVGMLMAASTGIVGATVVTMGLMSLPAMLNSRYDPALATGSICATGTLGQIIPPSIALVLLGDVLSNAYQQAQINQGIFNPRTVSVGDLFAGAVIPGLILVALYLAWIILIAHLQPNKAPPAAAEGQVPMVQLLREIAPPLILIIAVLGSILTGVATPTEAAGVGSFSWQQLLTVCQQTSKTTAMVFFILIGASIFSLVFRGYGGDELVHALFADLPGGVFGAMLVVMVVIFLLGFILDFIEITFVVVPIVGPVLLAMGVDPIWLGIMIAVNLQTSFLTPPFGFALFYLRGVAPSSVATTDIYRGVMPFIGLQLLLLLMLALEPAIATWLPNRLFG